ncbi:MAG: ABC transporter permease [Candidatus Njordarchaeales archaeon]
MAYFRVLKKGFSLAIRARGRSIIFVILFILATTSTILQLSRIYSYETHDLLRLKGVVLEPHTPMRADAIKEKLSRIVNDLGDILSGIYIVYGLNLLDDQLLIISVNAYGQPKFPENIKWVVSEFKPTTLIQGRYIENPREGIVNKGFHLNFTAYGTPMTVHLTVGDSIVFQAGYEVLRVKIVGITSSDISGFKKVSGIPFESVLFIDWSTFKEIATDIKNLPGPIEESPQVYVLRIILVVKGSALSALLKGDIFNYRERVKEYLDANIHTLSPLSIVSVEEIIPSEYQSIVLLLIVSIIFQIIVAGIYAILVIRLRRKDIATLRALGWESKYVKVFVVGEFLSILFIGFILGITIGALYDAFILRIPFNIIPYIIVLFSNLLLPMTIGIKYTSSAALSIPPSEAFRRE